MTAILRRAAEVDVERSGAIDITRLREIAGQAGISARLDVARLVVRSGVHVAAGATRPTTVEPAP